MGIASDDDDSSDNVIILGDALGRRPWWGVTRSRARSVLVIGPTGFQFVCHPSVREGSDHHTQGELASIDGANRFATLRDLRHD